MIETEIKVSEEECLQSSSESQNESRPPLWKRLRSLVIKNFLPISLLFFVILGILAPEPGVFLGKLPTHYVCVVGLFFHSGLKLKTGEVKDALKSIKALTWGIVCILLITPLVGGKLTGLLPFDDDHMAENGLYANGGNDTANRTSSKEVHRQGSSVLGPPLFQIGMQIYFIVPCTISAGVLLTAQAGGAVALSVMLTVICNLAAVFTVPPLIAWIIAFENVTLDPIKLLVKLVLTVLLPVLVGKALRYIPLVRTGVNKYSVTLKLISIVLLTMIPWMKVSQASTEGGFGSVSITSLASVLGWGLAMHILFIGIIFPPCLALKLNAPALKSVVIMASQKSLAVAVTISGYLPFSQAEQGIITLPLIVIHLGILIGDSILASCWFARDAKREKEAANRSTEVSIVDDKCEKNGIEFATSVTNQTLRITSL